MEQIQLVQLSPEELVTLIKKNVIDDIDNLLQEHLKGNSSRQKDYLSRQETAEYLGITLTCIHNWVRKTIITPYKLGNRTYFLRSEIVEKLQLSNSNE